ncbi:MAG: N-acetylneuraminate synthase family protein, partial [Pseudomonadota bacterium]
MDLLDERLHEDATVSFRQVHKKFLSTPFDEASADALIDLQVPAVKVGSGELTNLPFLRYLARQGLPMIVSTGMADLPEVGAAVDAVRESGGTDLVLLHCVSA